MAARQRSQQQETELEKRYIQLTASFAMSPTNAPRFELFLGFHPLELRFLSVEEESTPLALLWWTRRKDLLSLSRPNSMEQLALLWLKHFPEIDDLFSRYKERSDFEEALAKEVLRHTEVLSLAYAFYPFISSSQIEQYSQVEAMQKKLQRAMEEKASSDSRAKSNIIWTLPFPAIGRFGQEIERRAGLSSRLKTRLSSCHC